jgi:acetoin:2,6-dichlorophenolindophenol oxidoreductase subunit alpha
LVDQDQSSLNIELLSKMYAQMFLIRELEERVQTLFMTEVMPGTIHSSIGQEAVAVGVVTCLLPEDVLCGSHRGHGQYIVKGGEPRRVMAELFGKRTGCSGGMGGSVHLSGKAINYFPGVGILGAHIPIAAGAALSFKLDGAARVAAAIFGDGAANTGYFHEGLNLAAIWDLPVVFVCENNFYAVSVPVHQSMKVETIASRASAYGIEGLVVDGNDVIAVHQATRRAVDKARSGGGPTLLELQTYRHKGHSRFDPASYRPPEEVAAWMKKDPIPRLKNILLEKGVTPDAIEALERQGRDTVEEAVLFARQSPLPDPQEAMSFTCA